MKRRILFVDDESLILSGLQRMMRSARDEWDMEFAAGASEALELMAETSFDVIITDMRMPGMNGVELLETVFKLHPNIARIILSGHSDKDMILRCLNVAHQYLSKPCDSESIKSTVRRLCASMNTVEDESVRRLVSQTRFLPSLPAVYLKIVEELKDPSATIERVGEIMSGDLAMTAQILKFVNSAFFGVPQPITTSAEAVTYLGLDTIKSLVLSVHIFSEFQNVKKNAFDLDLLMQHSARTAAAAKQIANLEAASTLICNECYMAGMLHDIGTLVLAANFPSELKRAVDISGERNIPHHAAEKEVFGADHGNIGGYLLGLWGLPARVVEAILLHHTPLRSSSREFAPLTAVHCADAFEHEEGAFPSDKHTTETYLADLKLSHRAPVWRAALKPLFIA